MKCIGLRDTKMVDLEFWRILTKLDIFMYNYIMIKVLKQDARFITEDETCEAEKDTLF